MLAAVSGLAYTLATLLKLESYLGYFLPMPVIVAAMRSGPASGRKTMTATCFLLLCKHTQHVSISMVSWHVLHCLRQLGESVCIALQKPWPGSKKQGIMQVQHLCTWALTCLVAC